MQTKKIDALYQEWLRKQKSCLSGKQPCISAHVRRANNSGVGCKPLCSGVPLTDEEHRYQHQHGELDCILKYGRFIAADVMNILTRQDQTIDDRLVRVRWAKGWFDYQAQKHFERFRLECVTYV